MTQSSFQKNTTSSNREEIDGLFCEEVLREWLLKLQRLVEQQEKKNAAEAKKVGTHGDRTARLKVVNVSGRGP